MELNRNQRIREPIKNEIIGIDNILESKIEERWKV